MSAFLAVAHAAGSTILTGVPGPVDPNAGGILGTLQNLYLLALGLAGLLALGSVAYGAVLYTLSPGNPSKLSDAWDRIVQALVGVLLLVGAGTILTAVNPGLLSVELPRLQPVAGVRYEAINIVNLPDAGDDTVDPNFAKNKRGGYGTDASLSPGAAAAAAKLRDGWAIRAFTVDSSTNKMTITLAKGTETDSTNVIDMAPGVNGYAAAGQGQQGDKKTPIGTWSIVGVRYRPGEAQFNAKGSNMGAAFWHLSPGGNNTGSRGIGIHGSSNGTIRSTAGCIRLKNTDILALQPYVKTGIRVVVK